MKLRTRLIIAFLVITLVPIVLLVCSYWGFSHYQINQIEENYGVMLEVEDLSDSMMLIGKSTQMAFELMQQQARLDKERFLDKDYLEAVNKTLTGRSSWLLMRLDGELYFNGSGKTEAEAKKLMAALPAFRSFQSASDGGSYIGKDIEAFVKQLDITFDDGSKGSVFIISSVAHFVRHTRNLLVELMIAAVFILLFTATLLIIWIYASINNPLKKLSEATNRIRNEDFEFELEASGPEEISRLCQDFDAMRRKLKEQAEAKDEFDRQSKELISNISHDLKTPITAVKGYVEGIRDGVADTPEKMDRYIRTIYVKANDMDRLIDELTFYSKIDTNRIPYKFIRLNVLEYFDDCAEDVGLEMRERGIRFSYINSVAEDIEIIADAEQLKRVINNIIGNAIKYMDKAEQKVELRVKDVGDFIQVEIEDNGKGIAADELPNIFERFYRADASRNSAGGSGIGLSIVKKIVEDHNGRIWVNSRVGEGTTLFFVVRKYVSIP